MELKIASLDALPAIIIIVRGLAEPRLLNLRQLLAGVYIAASLPSPRGVDYEKIIRTPRMLVLYRARGGHGQRVHSYSYWRGGARHAARERKLASTIFAFNPMSAIFFIGLWSVIII